MSSAMLQTQITSPSRRSMRRWLRESPLSAGVISVVIHLAAFGILMHVAWQERATPRREIIAEAWLGPPGGSPSTPPTRPPTAETPTEKPTAAPGLEALAPPTENEDELTRLVGTIAANADEVLAPPPNTSTGEAGTLTLTGDEGLGPAFGGVAEAGPGSSFFGQHGNAYKVVYVIDTSGSLGWIFEPVQQALIQSIDQLRPTQSFHVIFAGSRPVELPARKLVPAIAYYTEPAKKFVRELVPELQCDPIAAMRRAFDVEPELIYLLTDGDFGLAGAELLGQLRQWNADGRVRITTIGFGIKLKQSQLAGTPVGEPILRQIAEEHGGNFRWVSPDETGGTP